MSKRRAASMTASRYAKRERRAQVAGLYKKRYRMHEIAEMLGIARKTVMRDIRHLEELWIKSQIEDIQSVKLRELSELDEMERTCIERLEKCTQPWQGARWMEERRKVKERRASILGIDAPKNLNITTKDKTLTKEQRDAAFKVALGVANPAKMIDDMMNDMVAIPVIPFPEKEEEPLYDN